MAIYHRVKIMDPPVLRRTGITQSAAGPLDLSAMRRKTLKTIGRSKGLLWREAGDLPKDQREVVVAAVRPATDLEARADVGIGRVLVAHYAKFEGALQV
jgi:hypothetical protein